MEENSTNTSSSSSSGSGKRGLPKVPDNIKEGGSNLLVSVLVGAGVLFVITLIARHYNIEIPVLTGILDKILPR